MGPVERRQERIVGENGCWWVISCISFPRLSRFSFVFALIQAFEDVLQFDHTWVAVLPRWSAFASAVDSRPQQWQMKQVVARVVPAMKENRMSVGKNPEIVPYQTFWPRFWMRCWLIPANNKVTCCSLLFFLPMPQTQGKIDERKMLNSWTMYFFWNWLVRLDHMTSD